MRKIILATALAAVTILGGCATLPPGAGQPPQAKIEHRPPGGLRAQPAPAVPASLPPAALALAHDADLAAGRRDWGAAARDLERALNIAPRSALLWQRLAAVRYSQGRYRQVETLAHKSNALAGGDRAIRRINWRMIAAARAALGDRRGAEEAMRHADALKP
ncbi:hypothetical protein [Acidihalobacter prosperus]|uniref:Tetratricopeptide repeat protein n=1 Tax=Acidihalobacter prosperus TaxID=160660 RepID=A0A1A6C7H0_9GAMM|nr:hypothetical protein [Acidihalobacter prosperus]OBS10507.1 hypothetical protein Thpro_020223 [Acidihalobacter prosperus]